MSKETIDLRRIHPKKRWRCLQCKELVSGDQYELQHKTPDGSLFALVMCIRCLYKRIFRKKDYNIAPKAKEEE